MAGFGQYAGNLQYNYDGLYKYQCGINFGRKYETKLILADGSQSFYVDGVLGGTWNRQVINGKTLGGKITVFKAIGSTLRGNLRIYYIRFTNIDETVVLADLVPCYRRVDSEPGMFDLVSKTFLTNMGTGEFVVGQDIK